MNYRRVFEVNALEDSFEETQSRNISAREYKKRPDYFNDYTEKDFIRRFRLSKSTFQLLVEKIDPIIRSNTNRNHALSVETKVLVTLRFYASGSFLITVGDFCGLSVSAASRAVKKGSFAIASLSKDFIKFPNACETHSTVEGFYKIAKFPKVIGAIDCTHIRIQSPGGEIAEIYRNRKGFFSLNVQAVCDASLIFEDLVARWPGSSHDSNIFGHSRLKFRMENGEFSNTFSLGDSGYQVSEYMMTPLLNPISEPEKLYNESQIRTRNCIERCFVVWKRRFPVLSMGMRISTDTAMVVVVSCGVLHNMSIMAKDPLPEEEILLPQDPLEDNYTDNFITNNRNARNRTILIANYFGSL